MGRFWAVILLAGFIGGVSLRSFVNFGWAFALFFVCLGIVVLIVSFIADSRKLTALISIFIIATGLGILRYELKDYKKADLAEGKIVLEGIISDEPDERENYTRLVLDSGGNKILLYANHYPEYRYGDKIKVNGLLRKPQNINASFDWISYLTKDDIYFEMTYPKMDFISSGNGSWVKERLFALKENFLNALGRVIPEPNSAFMGGLTVGARKSIPKDLQDDFRKTGIIHIVVLSGYNITIVSDTIMRFFSFLPMMFGITLGVLGIILFTVMTGAGAATVRASIMALLVVLARTTGRIYQITWALFLTGFLMIFYNPKILRFDTGFQLSFLATLALIYLAPYFTEKFKFITQRFKLREIISSTCATQFFVLPLLLYKTGILSLVALPVNLLVLPFIPVTMFFGFATYILSIPFGWVGYIFTQYELWIVKIFASLPFAAKIISNFPLWLMLIIYIFYAIIIYAKIYKKR
ncbi:MAG: ComEC/Rec2 family competence protein [Candidatus Parcubacteria bacterium]|nr:ComEC/Rec2 family competence protein [Candidatus Parcubacteria bacterium]